MRIYVSGPITGRPNLNREAFAWAAGALGIAGHSAVNPHDPTSDYEHGVAKRTGMRVLAKSVLLAAV